MLEDMELDSIFVPGYREILEKFQEDETLNLNQFAAYRRMTNADIPNLLNESSGLFKNSE